MAVAPLTEAERRACNALGVSVKTGDVKSIRRDMRACGAALRRKPRPDPVRDRAGFLRSLLQDAEMAVAHATADGSHQATVNGQRQIAILGEKLANDMGARAAVAGVDGLTEDEFAAELRVQAEEMPETHLRIFVDAWMERHRMVAVARSA